MKTTLLITGMFIAFAPFTKRLPACTVSLVSLGNDTVPSPKKNIYADLRGLALSMNPEKLGIKIPAAETQVFGVVMDWHMGDAIATIACYTTGDASLYLSTGGAILGGGQHEKVSAAAKVFVKKAQGFLARSMKTATTVLPVNNQVQFFLLTNKGKYTAREYFKNFENNSSGWLPMFSAANDVITELRLVQEKKQ